MSTQIDNKTDSHSAKESLPSNPDASSSSSSSIAREILLGKGSYGTVIQVEKGGQYYARKRLSNDKTNGIGSSSIRECSLLSFLNHPFIMKPVAYEISNNGTIDIFLPLAQSDLHNWIEKFSTAYRCNMFLDIAYRLLSVTSYIHHYQIIHRDIKPSNILLDSDNNIYLADFGAARFINPENMNIHPSDGSKTESKKSEPHHSNLEESKGTEEPKQPPEESKPPIKETPRSYPYVDTIPKQTKGMITYVYRPPELASDNYNTKADIYSIGCSLIHLLAGNYPIHASKSDNLLNTEPSDETPPTPHEWMRHLEKTATKCSLIPLSWVKLLFEMIQPDPESRSSAIQLLENPLFHSLHSYYEKKLIFVNFNYRFPGLTLNEQQFLINKIPFLETLHRTLATLCEEFKLSCIFNQTWETFKCFLLKESDCRQIDLYCSMVVCFYIVSKMCTEKYPHILDVSRFSRISALYIIKLESYVFLTLNFSVRW